MFNLKKRLSRAHGSPKMKKSNERCTQATQAWSRENDETESDRYYQCDGMRAPSPILADEFMYTDECFWPYNNNDHDETMISVSSPNYDECSDELINEEFHTYSCIPTDFDSTDISSRGILRFKFTIEKFTAFKSAPHTTTSESFKVRDIPFSLIVQSTQTGIAAYLKRNETDDQDRDDGLDIYVSCDISVVSEVDEVTVAPRKRSYTKCLLRAGKDWGFKDILSTVELNKGEYLHNDCLVFDVQVKADPPHCHSNYSKTITGYVGIRNQGATCYMNSLLQVLFFITKFRTACYRIPTEMDNNASIALALQKVFYKLQFSNTAVCTKILTRSFGWSTVDVLMQHDIQEMMRVLIEKIESRMKNTLLEPILPSMFQGKFVSYVQCRDVEFSSQREEVFYDIQLSLENANNVYESFKQYVSPEIMDNENKYDAGNFGLQAAKKGTLFINLPPVMFLHLLRFQFDATTNQVVKNNNFYEFYDHLDLAEFVREDETTPTKYTLFAVLAHSGGGSHGHYVAYINPSLTGNWFKFDDDTISICLPSDAIDSNFGSLNDVDDWTKSMQLNAYMLVYIRDSDVHEIFEAVNPMYITEEFAMLMKIDPEQEHCNILKRNYYTVDINIFLETFLESDVRHRRSKFHCPPTMSTFSVERDITVLAFKKTLQTAFNVSDSNEMRIWSTSQISSYNGYAYSTRPIINEDALLVPILSYPYAIWLELADPGCELPQFDPEEDVLVLYYYYDAQICRPSYIHHGYHHKKSMVDELVPLLNRLMNWSNQELNIYQEIEGTDARELVTSNHFEDYVQQQLETFVMTVVFEPKKHNVTTKLNSISSFYNDLQYHVTLRMSNDDDMNKDENFTFSLLSSFPELLDKMAVRLNYDRKKIQIFKCQSARHNRGEPIPSTSTETLSSLLNCAGHQTIDMFYKLHKTDVSDIENKINFTFHWQSIDMKETKKLTMYISNDDTIESILAAAEKLVSQDVTNGSGKFRFIIMDDYRSRVLSDSKPIFKYLDEIKRTSPYSSKRKYFRMEEIPKGDDVLNENEKNVFVFYWRQSRFPVYPLIFKINLNEPWQSAKNRLRIRLNLSEAQWENFQPVILTKEHDEVDIDDTQCLNDFHGTNAKYTICLQYNNYSLIKRENKREFNKIELNK